MTDKPERKLGDRMKSKIDTALHEFGCGNPTRLRPIRKNLCPAVRESHKHASQDHERNRVLVYGWRASNELDIQLPTYPTYDSIGLAYLEVWGLRSEDLT